MQLAQPGFSLTCILLFLNLLQMPLLSKICNIKKEYQVLRRRGRKPSEIPLTGIVNGPKDTTLLEHLLKNEKIKPLPVKKLVTYETQAKTTITVTACYDNRDSDVGDIAIVSREGSPVTLSSSSDADIIINCDDC